jgi:EAL domain-containing protein (putative c-di-GMP-specific phosphodiesterase class I)
MQGYYFSRAVPPEDLDMLLGDVSHASTAA